MATNGVSRVAPDWELKIDQAKRRERSELELHEWRKFGFATTRADDFEALVAAPDNPPGFIDRVACSDLTQQEFWDRYESQGKPVIVTGIPQREGWPAWTKWSWHELCRRFSNVPFKVGKDDQGNAVKVRLGHFASYMHEQRDDSPLYVFDSAMGGAKDGVRQAVMGEYKVPGYFPDDFMALAGEEGRPPYRWLLLGPKRSGTPVHIDPLVTSAWNTLLRGRKRWVLMKPSTTRKVAKGRGVMRSDEDDEAVNHFVDLVPRLRKEGHEVFEFVQYPGDTVFVPGNWWHSVVNIEDTVAVTQNYAGRINFPAVWRCARTERPCWSHKWLAAMDVQNPPLAELARRLNSEDAFDMQAMLDFNRERRRRMRCRRDWRALRTARAKQKRHMKAAAKGVTGPPPPFDEAAFWMKRKKRWEQDSSDSCSTVSTSSSETASSSTTDSSDSSSDSSSS
eukprot:Hpha_TRINITY_DN15900_c0_g15::TRINITY_DN15900_c0_g15_i1::g.73772::m.73772/K11323/JMJD6; histone arginine demethylase JMJD6